jgi:hypothetical protein
MINYKSIFGMFLSLAVFSALSLQTTYADSYYKTMLTPGQEVHTVESDATGKGHFTLKEDTLHYDITLKSLNEDDITGAHFHLGQIGKDGDVLEAIKFDGLKSKGTWEMSESEMKSMILGDVYINVHTTDNPAGELRGQVWLKSNHIYSSMLSGSAENPAVETSAAGVGVFMMADNWLRYDITTTALSGGITGAHIHKGGINENGDVEATLSFNDNHSRGVWMNLSADQKKWLMMGNYYVNVHTDANAGGELRGQIMPLTRSYVASQTPMNCKKGALKDYRKGFKKLYKEKKKGDISGMEFIKMRKSLKQDLRSTRKACK